MIDDNMVEPGQGPYTKDEATVVRNLKNQQIVGCWWCLNEPAAPGANHRYQKPYWPAERCEFRGHRIICPKHLRQEKEGLIETRGGS